MEALNSYMLNILVYYLTAPASPLSNATIKITGRIENPGEKCLRRENWGNCSEFLKSAWMGQKVFRRDPAPNHFGRVEPEKIRVCRATRGPKQIGFSGTGSPPAWIVPLELDSTREWPPPRANRYPRKLRGWRLRGRWSGAVRARPW